MSTWTDNLTMETMAKERANPPFDVRKVSRNLFFFTDCPELSD